MIQPVLCPVCGKTATEPTTSPFCCERCRRIDFFRWWDGRYAIREPLTDDVAATLAEVDPDDTPADRESW